MIDKEMLVDQLNGMLRVRRKMGDMSNRQYDEVSSEINIITILLHQIGRGKFDIEVEKGYKMGSFCEDEISKFRQVAIDKITQANMKACNLHVDDDGIITFGFIRVKCEDETEFTFMSNGKVLVEQPGRFRAMNLASDILPSDYYDEFGVHTGR